MEQYGSPEINPIYRSGDIRERGFQNLRTITAAVSLLTGIGAIGLILLFRNNPSWQLVALAGIYAACSAFGILSLTYLTPKKKFLTSLIGISVMFSLAMLSTSALLSGLGFPIAVVYLIFILIISSYSPNAIQGNLIAGFGIVVAGIAALFNEYSPFPQLSDPLVVIITPAILGILLMVYVVLVAMQSITATLRTRLVTTFLAIVLIPLGLLSIFQSQFIYNVLNDEINQVLLVTAQQTAREIDDYIVTMKQSLESSAQADSITRLLDLPAEQRMGSPEEAAANLSLQILQRNLNSPRDYLTSYALLDLNGTNLYDSLLDAEAANLTPSTLLAMDIDPERFRNGERPNESTEDYFLVPVMSGVSYISPFMLPNSTRGFFTISTPVKNGSGTVIGVIRLRLDGMILQNQLRSRINSLGQDTYPMLFDENNIRLADTFTPQYLYKAVAPLNDDLVKILTANKRLPNLPAQMLSTNFGEFNEILNSYETRETFSTEISTEYETNDLREIGAIARMNSLPWKVVYLQTNYSNQALRSEQGKLITLVTTLVAVFVGLLAIAAAQLLSNPIIKLADTAQKITEGNLEARAPAQGDDEYGMLGRAFNAMTSQMHGLITQLEERVRSRTNEIENQNEKLQQRANQLETVSDVARQIVSSQELEPLLVSITRLISERFGYYHVGIFLLDNTKENAILRAANSQGGQKMLSRQHRLPVGKVGIVGYVTGTGEPRIATDVGQDAVFFNNPDLPETRSEMALPLKVGKMIIGALDIQSNDPDAFHKEEVELFSTLADQVAIAIYNNQLYVETLRALDETQALHTQYLHSEWAKETAQRKVLGYTYTQNGVFPQQRENQLWKDILQKGEAQQVQTPSSTEESSSWESSPEETSSATVAVPITIRGETIGVIQVQDQGGKRAWTKDDMRVMSSISDQIAAALENARLFETTVRRAEREKKVLQITARIRATNNPEEMMQIAASELQQALSATRAQIYIRQPGNGETKE